MLEHTRSHVKSNKKGDGNVYAISRKMVKDNPSIMFTKVNFELLCDVNLFIFLSCLLPMLEIIHALIKFTKKRDVFVCNYVATIKICQG
jgi:hypothetical protein